MPHNLAVGLAGVLVLGILAQWTAWRIRLPSILLLLAVGVLAGPVVGWIRPDEMFGPLLQPVVSLSVAVILYEGGLSLKLRELQNLENVLIRLTLVGAAVTWTVGTLAAVCVLRLDWEVAALLGAILVVTGPTVIGPILRHLHLRGDVGTLLKWEGIVIDPVGATLGVLVLAMIRAGGPREALTDAGVGLLLTLTVGVAAGAVAAGAFVLAVSRFQVPDNLHNPVSLMLMFVGFTAANLAQHEAGLLAVTVMGVLLANQRRVSIAHVVRFKESLTILLIGCLFVLLSARLQPAQLRDLGWHSLAFVAVMMLVARPLSVLLATWRSPLTWADRGFLCCMAPRGIVAAAISSVFAADLKQLGFADATAMVPTTFLLVFVTVLIYGLSAAPLARALGLIQPNPQGVLFVGADAWVRAVAATLREEGFAVALIDTDRNNVRLARLAGLTCVHDNALTESLREELNYAGLGRMLAVTTNSEVNSLACLHFQEEFGRKNVYQLPDGSPSDSSRPELPEEHRGRVLFAAVRSFAVLADWLGPRPTVKKTKLTKEFDFAAFQAQHGDAVLPIAVVKPNGLLQICARGEPSPVVGEVIVSLVGSVSGELAASA